MDNFTELMMNRRSIRKYTNELIPKDLEKELLEAVRSSQSWANTQCWEIIIVKDVEKRKALQGTFEKNPAIKTIVDAPLLFAFCAKAERSGYYNDKEATIYGDWFMYDLGIATQTFCLFAASKGLGSVVTGLFDHDKASKILNLPEDVKLVSLIPVGYPAKNPKPTKRKEIEEFAHIDEFGNQYK